MGKNNVKKASGRIGLLLLATVLTFSVLFPVEAHAAASFSDIKGHWAQPYIERAVKQGFIKGYPGGKFEPDKRVTRAEFVSMINRALGNSGTARIAFSDVRYSEWYYSDVAKAVGAAFAAGFNDATFKPNQSITRQEASVMISKVIPTYGYSGKLRTFSDYRSISDWAYTSMSKVNGKGYMTGYSDGKIHPLDSLTRAQAAKIIGDIIENETIVSTDPIVKKDGTKLSGKIYSNNVSIHRDLSNGSATVDNCVILGNLNVLGGGIDTVTINNSRVVNASVNRSASPVRLLVKGETSILNTTGEDEFILQTASLAGGSYGLGFERISVSGSATAILRGNFPYVSVDGNYAKVKLETGTVNDLLISADGRRSDITAESGATIKSATVRAESYFHGKGTISDMKVYAKNITYETKPRSITVGSGGSTPTQEDPALDITFNPKKAETNVYLDAKITLTFNTAMRKANGNTITSSDIEDIVTLRKGSSGGTSVSYSAVIDTAKKVITLTPSSTLSSDTRYYIIIKADTMRDAYGNYNDGESSYFTTGDTTQKLITTFAPANGATGVPVDIRSFTIGFSDKVMKYNGSAFDSGTDRYLKNSVVVFQRNGANVNTDDYTVSINSTRKTITITPNNNLTNNTKYYIGIRSSTLKTVGGTSISATGATWSTAGTPVLSSLTTTSYEQSVDIKATPNVNGTIYAVALKGGSAVPSAQVIKSGKDSAGNPAVASVNGNANASSVKTLSMTGLSRDTQYTIYAVLYDGNGNVSAVMTGNVTTQQLHLKSLTLIPVGGTNLITNFSPEKLNYTVTVANGTKEVVIAAEANADVFNGSLTIGGEEKNTAHIILDSSGETSIPVIVREEGSAGITYQITIKEAGSSALGSVTINGTDYTIGSKYMLDNDASSVVLNIKSVDPQAGIWIDNESVSWGTDTKWTISPSISSITFQIRSKDGSSTKSYKIEFIWQPAPQAEAPEI